MRILISDSHRTYGITEYVVDNINDLNTVPKRNVGDTCYIIETGEQKILTLINDTLDWVPFITELTLFND